MEVDDAVARKWKLTSVVKRNKLITFLSNALDLLDEPVAPSEPVKGYGLPDEKTIEQFEKTVRENQEAYTRSLQKVRREAKAGGLTEEILERLLNE